MARIIGAIATSHTPTIGFAYDRNKGNDPVWAPIFEAYKPIQDWLAANKPDVLFIVYNDHVTSFFFDHYSAFTLGIDDRYEVADEGGGAPALPPVKGHARIVASHRRGLMADEFDMSFFQDHALDHGCFSPLSMMCPHEPDWPVSIVPLQVGVLQFPIPSALRCWKLGQSVRRAIESYPEDLKVALVATGGLSHQVHGERAGFNNTAWDAQFLDLIERDPAQAHRDDACRLRAARRPRGRRSHHVARDARGDVGECPQGPPELLSALGDRDRDRDLRERGDRGAGRDRRTPSRAYRRAVAGRRNR